MQPAQKTKAPAIDSSIMILDLLASSPHSLTLSEICEGTLIPAASVHRIIHAMLDHQLITIDPSRKKSYCVGSKVFQIASTIYNKQSLIPLFYPIAEILKNEIHKVIFLSVPIGNQVVVVSKIEYSATNVYDVYIGQTLPLYLTAAGKAILSMRSKDIQNTYLSNEIKFNPSIIVNLEMIHEELARAKRLGYATMNGEVAAQISCIAAPILNLRNEPIAAISAAINGDFINPKDARQYSKNLIQAARQLSSRIA